MFILISLFFEIYINPADFVYIMCVNIFARNVIKIFFIYERLI